ncbi:T9SS type A sorting domain-containing protein [Flammeovirga pacifica]|uniref:Secretion system C-terminal sorting domain-containing protein n=1 Tax=Flammeovirga pacifica TaxID=915059 RepID=A0A1S1Z221_FLAPC|nr:T9SS type A sorting domain-containing protein [Flammeovirga pacifica]OHX67291.1 hypothetical protein NH26_13540 [Flammeovirga pacifica]
MKSIYTILFSFVLSTVSFSQNIYTGGESGQFTYAEIINDTDLPVTFGYFTATKKAGIVEIKWSTYTEINNDYFIVERSLDGLNWSSIGQVNGFGNSNIEIEYQFTDTSPFLGTAYYRIKQTDYDGQSEYFGPKKVSNNDINTITIYPNPNSGFFYIKMNKDDLQYLKIFDSLGKNVIYNIDVVTDNLINITLNKHKKGIYYIKYRNSSFPMITR